MLTTEYLLLVFIFSIITVTLSFLIPRQIFLISFLTNFFTFPLYLVYQRISFLTISSQLICLICILALKLRKELRRETKLIVIFVTLLSAMFFGLIASFPEYDIIDLLGARSLAIPFLIALYGLVERQDFRYFLNALVFTFVFSSVFSVFQYIGGAYGLRTQGYQYGTRISEIAGGRLRAPGLFANNFEFGMVALFVFIVCILTIITNLKLINSKLAIVGLAASLVALYTSAHRASAIIAFVSLLTIILYALSTKNITFSTSFLISTLCSIALIAVMPVLSNSTYFYLITRSLSLRLELWSYLINKASFFGGGLGTVGTVTTSQFAESQIFADNFYISVLLQTGIMGFVLFLIFIWRIMSLSRLSFLIMIPLICLMIAIEAWDYWIPTTLFLMLIVNVSNSGDSGSSSTYWKTKESRA